MSGFTGIYLFDERLKGQLASFVFPIQLTGFFSLKSTIEECCLKVAHYGNDKFTNDSQLSRSGDLVCGIEGVILDDEKNHERNQSEEIAFPDDIYLLKGSFSAFQINKIEKKISVLADKTGSRQIFYYYGNKFFAFSSSIFLLKDILSHFSIKTSLNIHASYMMLTLGYLLKDYTLVDEIKKVQAGQVVEASSESFSTLRYHDYYKKTVYSKITTDLLSELDRRFMEAIRSEFDKDCEYQYSHLATLSGGLDSRMNVLFAHKAGYKNLTCLTFSEGFQPDELTARKISDDYAFKHIVLLLNKGFQLYDIKTPLLLNNCSVYYFGAAQTLAAVRAINFSDFGLFHNGGLAESSKGGYLSGPEHCDPGLDKRYAVSDRFFPKLQEVFEKSIVGEYQNEEMFVLYNRGFNAIHNGSWMTLPYTESVSTYMEPEFADLAFSISPHLRYNGYLTVEWLKKVHPEMAGYAWQHGIKPTNNKARILVQRVFNKTKRMVTAKNDSAVPFEKWYASNKELREFIETSFNDTASRQLIDNELQRDVNVLFHEGRVTEKLLCLSFLKSVELLF